MFFKEMKRRKENKVKNFVLLFCLDNFHLNNVEQNTKAQKIRGISSNLCN